MAGVAADFAEQVGRRPTLAELLEILGWAALGPLSSRVTFTALMEGGVPYRGPRQSAVGELDDAVFVDASDLLSLLARDGERRDDGIADPNELSSRLTAALQRWGGALADVGAGSVTSLTVDVPRARRPKVGDVLAIPASSGGYHLASVLARNRFGTALGVVEGTVPVPRVIGSLPVPAPARRLPVYTDDRLVVSGAWTVVGHDEALLALFPSDPEIYHSPEPAWPGVDLGEFGAAETASGEMRLLGVEEARAIGLLDGSYQQSFMPEELERLLDGQPSSASEESR
ncbi:hypothetical protein N865_11865 [Intrasporangium oryzae NRRL B-24470]|uniref:Uncharacterized protein n=1 Tax=Intrasporangium oryzae NRRL B-24470 TaxID=1386089 RepID=W9G8B6_9MICO|nr:hypothetical protein N865_11865 [Intrasporangium oryzae NRRL B-24470]